jgi:hypothetical protein
VIKIGDVRPFFGGNVGHAAIDDRGPRVLFDDTAPVSTCALHARMARSAAADDADLPAKGPREWDA